MVFYCHTKTRYLSMWCSTVTQRHGTCPCGALLSHKGTVPVPVVLFCHTKTRYLSAWYSTFTQTHGACPCCTLLPPRHTVSVPVLLDCHQETGRVHVVFNCQPETGNLSLWYSAVLMSHRYTVTVPVLLYCHTETWCFSLRFSTVTHGRGTCGILLLLRDIVLITVVLYNTCICNTLPSHIDTLPVPVVLYCHTKTRYQ